MGPGEVHTNIASPFFKSAKPDAARLKKEVLARDPTVRCSSFSVPRLLQVLCNLPVPVQAQFHQHQFGMFAGFGRGLCLAAVEIDLAHPHTGKPLNVCTAEPEEWRIAVG